MTRMNKCAHGVVVCTLAMLASDSARADEVFEQRTDTAIELATNGVTTVVEQSVPSGAWVISAKLSVESLGAADRVTCGLQANGDPIDSSPTMVGEADGLPAVTQLTSQRLWVSPLSSTIALVCSHELLELGVFVSAGASLLISGETIDCPVLETGQCPPGLRYVPPNADAASQGAVGVCAETDSGVPLDDPCLAEQWISDVSNTLGDSGEGPLLDECPRGQRYQRCTIFGRCWCSSNGRRR